MAARDEMRRAAAGEVERGAHRLFINLTFLELEGRRVWLLGGEDAEGIAVHHARSIVAGPL